MEAMRTTRLRPIGHKRQFQMINNPIHDVMLREEGNDLHPAPAFGTEHGVDFIDLPDHGSPARRFVCPPRGFRVRVWKEGAGAPPRPPEAPTHSSSPSWPFPGGRWRKGHSNGP